MNDLAKQELPRSMASDWTELTFLQLQAGNTAIYVFALAVVFVFLVLAAQYESWGLPLAVILVVPMCLLCSIVGIGLARMEVTIFTQIGFVVLVGLASKNAILIVEFAKQQQEQGRPRREATLEAARLRLAAHPDDILRLHLRRPAPGDRHRRRSRNAPLPGPGRLQRHARRDPVRHLSDTGLLLRHPMEAQNRRVHASLVWRPTSLVPGRAARFGTDKRADRHDSCCLVNSLISTNDLPLPVGRCPREPIHVLGMGGESFRPAALGLIAPGVARLAKPSTIGETGFGPR